MMCKRHELNNLEVEAHVDLARLYLKTDDLSNAIMEAELALQINGSYYQVSQINTFFLVLRIFDKIIGVDGYSK